MLFCSIIGLDIQAGCGQLKAAVIERKKHRVRGGNTSDGNND